MKDKEENFNFIFSYLNEHFSNLIPTIDLPNLWIDFMGVLPIRFWKFLYVRNQLSFIILTMFSHLDNLLWFRNYPFNRYVEGVIETTIQNQELFV